MSKKDPAACRKRSWERKHPGEIYPGPFTPEMRYKHTPKPRKPLEKSHKIKLSEASHGGVKSDDLPTIPPKSRTEQVIIGSLLGDGSVSPNGRFRETHCCEQKEILFELARLFETVYIFRDKISKKPMIKIRTRRAHYHLKVYNIEKLNYTIFLPHLPIFHELRTLWYPEGKKIVPDEILGKIGPQALAWWYMGDGSYSRAGKYAKFATRGFRPDDNEKLRNTLIKLGLPHTKVSKKNQIILNRIDTQKFLPMIAEYIVPSIRYKLGPLEAEYKPYNPTHHDPEPLVTRRITQI